jgi:hypothetical protein
MTAPRLARHARTAALASALFLAVGSTAFAGGPGPHGAGPRGDAQFEHVIAHLKTQLNLNSSQQVAFDNAVAASKAARATIRADMEKVRAAAQAELANAEPNLRNLATMRDEAHAKAQATMRPVRDQWLQLYETFGPEQKQVVRDALAKRMARMEAFRERMQSRFGG